MASQGRSGIKSGKFRNPARRRSRLLCRPGGFRRAWKDRRRHLTEKSRRVHSTRRVILERLVRAPKRQSESVDSRLGLEWESVSRHKGIERAESVSDARLQLGQQ